MKRTCISLGILSLLAAYNPTATSQTSQQTATPSVAQLAVPQLVDKHKQLAVLVGDWVISGKTYANSPWGVGNFTAREHNEFMKGGMFLISKTQYSEQFNNSSQIGIFGVDPNSKQFTFSLFNSTGVTVRVVGTQRDLRSSTLVGNAIYWGAPPSTSGIVPEVAAQKETNVATLAMGGAMTYTTEFISPNEYRFSMDRGGARSYEGVARRINAVSSLD